MANTQNTKRTATAQRPTAPENTAPADGEHVVKDGETLDKIAKDHDTTVDVLRRRNAIKHPDLIWPGMTLRTK